MLLKSAKFPFISQDPDWRLTGIGANKSWFKFR